MSAFLLSVHVLAAIVFVGPVTVATSLFPRYARSALREPDRAGAHGVVRLLHRISRGYAVLALTVPAFGVATAVRLGVLGDAWLITSIALTVAAAGVLAFAVLPAQGQVVARLDAASRPAPDSAAAAASGDDGRRTLARLGAASGVFALLWAVVVVLMIVRPGSTTGV